MLLGYFPSKRRCLCCSKYCVLQFAALLMIPHLPFMSQMRSLSLGLASGGTRLQLRRIIRDIHSCHRLNLNLRELTVSSTPGVVETVVQLLKNKPIYLHSLCF